MHGMHEKLRRSYPEIFTVETYKKLKLTEFTSMRSVKDMDSMNTWKMLHCFAFIMKSAFNHAKECKKDEMPQEGLQQLFLCSHLSMNLDRNPEADLQLSCLL